MQCLSFVSTNVRQSLVCLSGGCGLGWNPFEMVNSLFCTDYVFSKRDVPIKTYVTLQGLFAYHILS